MTVGSQAGCSSAQNETTIAVNPANPRNIVAGANDYRVFVAAGAAQRQHRLGVHSFDGGKTWKNQVLPGLTIATGATGALTAMDSAGDPVLAFGPRNTVYYGNIVFSRAAPAAGGTEAPSGIVVSASPTTAACTGASRRSSSSTASTRTGNFTPTDVLQRQDLAGRRQDLRPGVRELDPVRRHPRRATTSSRRSSSPPSTDFGRTFSPFTRVDTTLAGFTGGLTPFSQGSNPQVGRDGTLYIAYEGTECATLACDGADDRDVTVVARSTDHGRTFSHAIVDTNFDFPVNEAVGT